MLRVVEDKRTHIVSGSGERAPFEIAPYVRRAGHERLVHRKALDVLVAMLILGVFFFQIREQFDSLDLKHLEKLKEHE